MKNFVSFVDPKRNASAVINSSDYVDNFVLSPSVAKSITVPADARVAVFSSNGDFFYNPNGTAAIPGGDLADGSGSILNPTARIVEYLTSISVIADATTILTIEWFS